MIPLAARASILSDIVALFTKNASADEAPVATYKNVQTMPILKPAMNYVPAGAHGGGDVTIVDDSALMPAEGPSGTLADIEKPKNSTISKYIVRNGDTLGEIATMFNVTKNTIRWANDIPADGSLHTGQELTILPVPGLKYVTQKGDTLASVSTKFSADATEIANFNGVDDGTSLDAGTELIIPDGEVSAVVAPKPTVLVHASSNTKVIKHVLSAISRKIGAEPAHDVGPEGTPEQVSYYIAPLSDYIETQGIHGYNGVDLAAPVGTPILASASGDVVVAKAGGYNGGYGSYVVISHDNGSQTLYAHMSKVATYDGSSVVQGQVIGYVGSTGKSTGAHVHFEIRNGIKNPF